MDSEATTLNGSRSSSATWPEAMLKPAETNVQALTAPQSNLADKWARLEGTIIATTQDANADMEGETQQMPRRSTVDYQPTNAKMDVGDPPPPPVELVQEAAISAMLSNAIGDGEVVGSSKATQAPSKAPSSSPSNHDDSDSYYSEADSSPSVAKRHRAGPARPQPPPGLPTPVMPRPWLPQYSMATPRNACTNRLELDFQAVANNQFFDLERTEHTFSQCVAFTAGAWMTIDTPLSRTSMKNTITRIVRPRLRIYTNSNLFILRAPKHRHSKEQKRQNAAKQQ